jgi:hypothetical protein
MSLEYSLFRFSDDYPTAEGLSEMIMQVCMDRDPGDFDRTTRLISALVSAAYQLRCVEAAENDEDGEANITIATDAADLFVSLYVKACKQIGEPCNDGDAWWEDWWPTDCPWHPHDLAHLARLKAGETKCVRRQLRAEFAKHKEVSDVGSANKEGNPGDVQ